MIKFLYLILAVYNVYAHGFVSNPEVVGDVVDDLDKDEGTTQNNIRSIINAAMKTSDPIYVESIVAHLSTLNYTLDNVNIRGLGKCMVTNAEINDKLFTLNFHWTCHKFYLDGQYQIKGTILILPIEGNGDFNVRFGNYNTSINANLEQFQDNNGQTHWKIKSFFFGPVNYLEPVTYYATNLFNGDTRLAEEGTKFVNDNWTDMVTLTQAPILNAAGKQFLKNINTYLKRIPVKDIIN